MRVLGVLAAWGVLAVLATLCFAVGGSIGYRRGVQDAVRQLRERRNGSTGCRPLPLPHHRRRPVTRMHASPQRSAQARAAASPTVHRLRAHLTRAKMSPALAGAMAMVFLLMVPGAAFGATSAQPGEMLWPVKRGVEQARLVITTRPSSEMQLHVELASRRLDELDRLLASGDAEPALVDTVIADLRGHTEAAADQLEQVDAADRSEVAGRVEHAVRRQVAAIDVLLDLDCGATRDGKCVALDDTRRVSEDLHETMVLVVMGEGGASAAAVADPTALPSAAADLPSEAAAAAASEAPSAAAAASDASPSTAASGGAGAGGADASESPSAKPSESPSRAPATGGPASSPAATTAAAGNDPPPTTPANDGSGKAPDAGDAGAAAAVETPTTEAVP